MRREEDPSSSGVQPPDQRIAPALPPNRPPAIEGGAMATDINAIENNLGNFYDFHDKTVVHVGAGGGQFIGYSEIARSVLAIDIDEEATAHLEKQVNEYGLSHKFTIRVADFVSVSAEADVVFFEFCLHEMSNPEQVLEHAQTLAPDIVIIDHHPDSEWAWYVLEDEKARRSWSAARRCNVVRENSFDGRQYFSNYSQLYDKVKVMGGDAIDRISNFIDRSDIYIPMKYAIALIR